MKNIMKDKNYSSHIIRKVIGYWLISSNGPVKIKPPKDDLCAVQVIQSDNSEGAIPGSLVIYENLPDNVENN